MKKVIALAAIILFVSACEKDSGLNPNARWTIVESPTDLDLHEVFFVNPNVGFVAGTAAYEVESHRAMHINEAYFEYIKTGPHVITDTSPYYERPVTVTPENPEPSFFKTTDGGLTWKTVSTPFVTTVTDVFFVDESYGFVATREEGVYKTTNGGGTWEKVLANFMFMENQRIEDNAFSKVYFNTKLEGFAFNDEKNIVVKTTDGGENWEVVSSFDITRGRVEVQNMFFATGSPIGYGFSVPGGCCGLGLLFKTEDNGETWNEIDYSLNGVGRWDGADVLDMAFINQDIGVLTDGYGTYMTRDGGVNWERRNLDTRINGRAFTPDKITSLNERAVYVLDGDREEHNMIGEPYELVLNKCKVYYSDNSGVNFAEMTMQNKNANIKDWFFVGDQGYLVGENGVILKGK